MKKWMLLSVLIPLLTWASAQTLTVYFVDELKIRDGKVEVAPGTTTSISFPSAVNGYHINSPGTVDITADEEKRTLWLDTNGTKGTTGLIVKSNGLNLRFKVIVTSKTSTPVIMVQEKPEADPATPEPEPTAPPQTTTKPSNTNAVAKPSSTPTTKPVSVGTPTKPSPKSSEEVLPGVILNLESRGIEANTLTFVYSLENKSGTRMVIDPSRAKFEGSEARIKTLNSQIVVAPGASQKGVIEVSHPKAGRLSLLWKILTDMTARKKDTLVKVFDLSQFL